MVIGFTQNYYSVSLSLDIFKYLNFIDFVNRTISANKVRRVSLKLLQLKKFQIQPEQKFVQ